MGPNEQSSCFPQFPANLEGGDFPIPFFPCQVAPGRPQDVFTHLAFLEFLVVKNFVFSWDRQLTVERAGAYGPSAPPAPHAVPRSIHTLSLSHSLVLFIYFPLR